MEEKTKMILDYLDRINDKLISINKKLDLVCRESKNKEEIETEDEIMDFLKDITRELGIEDKVTIKKVESK
jgi:predicted RNA-binding protein Jag